MRIYVDKVTGTWGDADDIIIREATQEEMDDLDGLPDDDIIAFGLVGHKLTVAVTDRDLATILAALRYWQQDLAENPEGPIGGEHFAEVTWLSVDEIDILCEQINQ